MKFWELQKRNYFRYADVIEVFDSNGQEVPAHEFIDDAKVLEVQKRGGWLTVTIKRPRITYDEITYYYSGGYLMCTAKVNGYFVDRAYMGYPKRVALQMFHRYVNDMVA